MKKKNTFVRFITNRTFWISTATVIATSGAEIMPLVPPQYVALAGVGLILLNRLLKAAKEVKTDAENQPK